MVRLDINNLRGAGKPTKLGPLGAPAAPKRTPSKPTEDSVRLQLLLERSTSPEHLFVWSVEMWTLEEPGLVDNNDVEYYRSSMIFQHDNWQLLAGHHNANSEKGSGG